MISYNEGVLIGHTALGIAVISFVSRYKTVDRASKILGVLLCLTFLTERIADYSAHAFGNSIIVYGAFSPMQFFLISMYFNVSIRAFQRKSIGIIIGIPFLLMGYTDYFFIQGPKVMNSYFLLTESILVVGMCMYSFYRMMLEDEGLKLMKYPHFWFTSLFFLFWLGTFFIWGMYDFVTRQLHIKADLLGTVLLAINVLTYLGFAAVYFFYPKMHLVNEQ
ncbi:MAG: hypothetical protein JST70_10195 [Bacteroidetes bacterium]|nr:hypothetical protein [Bacteroidota bacterium]